MTLLSMIKHVKKYRDFFLFRSQNYGSMKNGQLHRLSTIRRTDQCNVTYEDQLMCTNLHVGWSDISVSEEKFFTTLVQKFSKIHYDFFFFLSLLTIIH